jgi:hypothetical protein
MTAIRQVAGANLAYRFRLVLNYKPTMITREDYRPVFADAVSAILWY